MRKVFLVAMLAASLLPAANASAQLAGEQRVAQQIRGHLKNSGQLHNYRVGVKYHDGIAYLAGSVENEEQRAIAEQLAQEVDGVQHVINKLEIPGRVDAGNSDEMNASERECQEMTEALNRTSFDGMPSDGASVKHAYQNAPGLQSQAMQPMPMQAQRMPMQQPAPRMQPQQARRSNMPVPAGRMPGVMPIRQASFNGVRQAQCSSCEGGGAPMGGPGCVGGGTDGGAPMGFVPGGSGRGPSYDSPQMPGYAWPSYASYPNYAALSYPQQYSPTAWPYIGPFYPYPQVPLAWRKVSLEWDDGWWFLDFSAHNSSH
jgi:hypothetical protein